MTVSQAELLEVKSLVNICSLVSPASCLNMQIGQSAGGPPDPGVCVFQLNLSCTF